MSLQKAVYGGEQSHCGRQPSHQVLHKSVDSPALVASIYKLLKCIPCSLAITGGM